MISITIPETEVTIVQRKQEMNADDAPIKSINGFIDIHEIPRDKGGIILFFNKKDELLLVAKARKLRQRVKKHLEDSVSPLKAHRDEINKISVIVVEDAMEREIYETYIINTMRAKYNTDKAFFENE
ncbi:nucleotide excision repair endonuclease [Sporosarcina sp. Sa2YVA2]|uniref:Nucleotide excision repair endonuclease n=1 Tax=Sporosarcina quadrami TaxID=2762234 RepID=A0ABR8U8M5_9BACL|nr:nucleotide excision repair endonuclease [Sporosarcina quadrami]MBD7984381.1 nucleotide excision repair endonuclease [Sporosarcina quadrami]